MDGETDNTDPDELRDSLLMEAMRGEITPGQAEEMAAARCLGPLTSRPALPRFDPKLKSHWSIVEAVAWIAWRNFEFVREQDPGFCSEWIRWSSCTWREPPTDGTARSARPIARKGWVLEPQRLPTLERLVLLEIIKRAEGNLPPTAVMTVREAQATLWRAASEGSLRAEGFNGEGAVVEIPSGEWSELRLSEKDGREALVDARTGVERYTAIKFRRSDLLRLWPGAAVESVAMPTVVIDKGGRPAEYNWPAMKAYALQQIKVLGRPDRNNKRLPSKAQLIELLKRHWAEQFDQHPSTSSVRSHLSQWLTETDKN